ncbi:hypothetical protein FRC00_002140, partial [Tulasnella sp. 408]
PLHLNLQQPQQGTLFNEREHCEALLSGEFDVADGKFVHYPGRPVTRQAPTLRIAVEGYQTNSLNPPLGPPHKRRRTSPRGSEVTSSSISPAQALRNRISSFSWTLGLEFAAIPAPPAPNLGERSVSTAARADGEHKEEDDDDEGGSKVVLSAKAKGKRPAK